MNVFDELRGFLEDEGVLHVFVDEYKKSYNVDHRIDEENFEGSVRVHDLIDASLYWASSGGIEWSVIHKKWYAISRGYKAVTCVEEFDSIVNSWDDLMFLYLKDIKNDY